MTTINLDTVLTTGKASNCMTIEMTDFLYTPTKVMYKLDDVIQDMLENYNTGDDLVEVATIDNSWHVFYSNKTDCLCLQFKNEKLSYYSNVHVYMKYKQAYSDFYNTEDILKDVIFEYWNEGHSWEDFWEYDFTWQ